MYKLAGRVYTNYIHVNLIPLIQFAIASHEKLFEPPSHLFDHVQLHALLQH